MLKQVARADEVDYMFFPHLPTGWLHVNFKGAPPGFCFVELDLASIQAVYSDQALKELKGLCTKRRVSSAEFRDKVFNVFRKSVNEERRAKGKIADRKRKRNHCYSRQKQKTFFVLFCFVLFFKHVVFIVLI